MSETPKHGGCADCGSKEDEILTSVLDVKIRQSKAVCSKCFVNYPGGASK